MQASPNPRDIYPAEIIEWSAMLAEPEEHSEHQQRAIDILTDDGVMHAARHVLDNMQEDNDRWQGEDRTSRPDLKDEDAIAHWKEANRLRRLDGFWRFIEEAAALPERQPPGSHLREPEEVPAFSTRRELLEDISAAASTSLKLARLLRRIAPTMTDHMDIADARRLIDSLNALHSACSTKAAIHSAAAQTCGEPDFPLPGSTAGANAWRNWLLNELNLLAALCLRGTYPAFVLEVHRAIAQLDMPIDARTARSNVGKPSYSVEL
ncbi:MAG: hypothetical protein RBS05_04095 [Zoogloea oleivorans]|uniref:hypothetical protein n=1 Tax=Zoogloea oleivorans TaxID=1552750 RepID=UPI002A35F8D7|nr:hypothetical protein [Zoogloea oleivorans]MDY0035072.1 hypothetical protein [Zoogloea oleivorans]